MKTKTILLAVSASLCAIVHADDYVWVGGESGDWNDKNNWSTGTVPGNYEHVTFTNTVTFSDGVMGNQYMYIHLTNDTAVLHLYAGGAHRAREIYVSGGGTLHLWEKDCLDLQRSDGKIIGGSGGSIICHGTDVFPPRFDQLKFPDTLDLNGFDQTITNARVISQGVTKHTITSETPAQLLFTGDISQDAQAYGYIRGRAGICWNPNNAARKFTFYGYESDTKGELIVSNGVMQFYNGDVKFRNLSKVVVGPNCMLKVSGTSTFNTRHLVMMAGATLDFGTSGTPATCALSRVTLVDEYGIATDLPQGVYGATAGEGVIVCDRIAGSHRVGVTPDTTYWKSAQDGNWGVAANWNLGVPSATIGTGITEAGGDYTVTLSEPASITNLTVENWGGGTATLNVASRLGSVKGMWGIGTGGRILIPEGGEAVYYGTNDEVTTKFTSSTEAFKVYGGGVIEVRGRLSITNMCGLVVLGQNGGSSNVTSKVVIAGNGEMSYHLGAKYDSYFRMYPGGCIEAKDYGVLRRAHQTESSAWSQQGGSLDFSGHSKYDANGMWDYCLGQGRAVFREDAKLVGDGDVGNGSARLYFAAIPGVPTEVWFKDRAVYSAGGTIAQTLLQPSTIGGTEGGRIAIHFDSAATHNFGYLRLGRTVYNGFADVYVSDGVVKADSTSGFNQGGASVSCDVNSFTTGHVYQTGGAFVVNGESGGYQTQFQYGFILGDGLTDTTVREPTVLGVYELSGGVVTNGQSGTPNSPFVLGIGRGRGEFIQTGGEFVSKTAASRRDRAPAILGYSNGYGYYTLSNGTASVSSKMWVGGVSPETCGFNHASYTGTEAVGKITVAAADRTKPCSFTVSDTVVLGGLGEGTLEVGPGGTFSGTDLVLSNNTASVLRLVADDSGFGAVNLSGRLTVTDGATLVVDATGFTGANARRCALLSCASMSGSFAPGNVTVLTDKPTEVQVSVTSSGIVLRKVVGTFILLR